MPPEPTVILATVSGVQSAVALEALVSAAFILIGSKLGDLFGCKRPYVTGLIFYASGALAMVFAQGLAAIIVFWAVIGGLGASLYLAAISRSSTATSRGRATSDGGFRATGRLLCEDVGSERLPGEPTRGR